MGDSDDDMEALAPFKPRPSRRLAARYGRASKANRKPPPPDTSKQPSPPSSSSSPEERGIRPSKRIKEAVRDSLPVDDEAPEVVGTGEETKGVPGVVDSPGHAVTRNQVAVGEHIIAKPRRAVSYSGSASNKIFHDPTSTMPPRRNLHSSKSTALADKSNAQSKQPARIVPATAQLGVPVNAPAASRGGATRIQVFRDSRPGSLNPSLAIGGIPGDSDQTQSKPVSQPKLDESSTRSISAARPSLSAHPSASDLPSIPRKSSLTSLAQIPGSSVSTLRPRRTKTSEPHTKAMTRSTFAGAVQSRTPDDLNFRDVEVPSEDSESSPPGQNLELLPALSPQAANPDGTVVINRALHDIALGDIPPIFQEDPSLMPDDFEIRDESLVEIGGVKHGGVKAGRRLLRGAGGARASAKASDPVRAVDRGRRFKRSTSTADLSPQASAAAPSKRRKRANSSEEDTHSDSSMNPSLEIPASSSKRSSNRHVQKNAQPPLSLGSSSRDLVSAPDKGKSVSPPVNFIGKITESPAIETAHKSEKRPARKRSARSKAVKGSAVSKKPSARERAMVPMMFYDVAPTLGDDESSDDPLAI